MNNETLFYTIMLDGLLFQEIKELLNNTHIGTNNLLNVSRNFKDLKQENFYWELKKGYSFIYYSSSPYRERITLLVNTKRQLSLQLNGYSEEVVIFYSRRHTHFRFELL
jgi:hypothetical protein